MMNKLIIAFALGCITTIIYNLRNIEEDDAEIDFEMNFEEEIDDLLDNVQDLLSL